MSDIRVTKNDYTVEPLYQWDVDQQLKIYGLSLASVPEVHFANLAMDRAIVRQATMDKAGVITVDVPNALLQKYYTITVYLCTYDGGTFQTLYKVEVPVMERPQPADYSIKDDPDVYSFKALENQVANVLNKFDEVDKKYNTSVANYNAAATAYNNAEKSYEKIKEADELVRTSYTRDETLDAATKEALGLPETAVPRDAFNCLTKIASGTYVGTGEKGSSHPNSLTFGFVPRVVIISGGSSQCIMVNDAPSAVVVFSYDSSQYSINVTWQDNTLAWYSAGDVERQLNTEGKTYYYVALG